jgi:hypothetical protein
MTLPEAFAFLERCRFWSIRPRAFSCSMEAPRPLKRSELAGWQPFLRASVRRGKDETLEAMVCRGAAKAAAQADARWKACQGCGSRRDVRPDRPRRLALCSECRAGLGLPAGALLRFGRPNPKLQPSGAK